MGAFGLAPRLQGVHQTGSTPIALQGSYGAVTDRGAFDVHHRLFFGPAYVAAIKCGYKDKDANIEREALISLRAGLAAIETTQFKSGSSREIKLTQGDLPDYRLTSGFGIEAEVLYPLFKQTFLTFGARIYGAGPEPNPWSAYIGITKPIDDIAKAIFPK